MNAERKHSVTLGSLIRVMLHYLTPSPCNDFLDVFFLPTEIEAVNIDSSSVLWPPRCCCNNLAQTRIYDVSRCKQSLFNARIKSWSAVAVFGGFNTTTMGLLTLDLGAPLVCVTSWGGMLVRILSLPFIHTFSSTFDSCQWHHTHTHTHTLCLSVIMMLNS